MATTKEYELLADEYNETTSKQGEPFTYKTYRKGDKVKLNAEQAERLIAAGAVADPDAKADAGEPGGKPKAPKGKAPGAGTGDADKGTAGDGAADPQGSGSTAAGGTGGGTAGSGS